ncbi:hypothetical protein J3F83DRAFT_643848 [Trichoderma novae-zelandiae]
MPNSASGDQKNQDWRNDQHTTPYYAHYYASGLGTPQRCFIVLTLLVLCVYSFCGLGFSDNRLPSAFLAKAVLASALFFFFFYGTGGANIFSYGLDGRQNRSPPNKCQARLCLSTGQRRLIEQRRITKNKDSCPRKTKATKWRCQKLEFRGLSSAGK